MPRTPWLKLAVVAVAAVIVAAVAVDALRTAPPRHAPRAAARVPVPVPALPASLFRRSVINQPVAQDSAQLVSSLVEQIKTHYGSVTVNGLPTVTAGPNQARVNLAVTAGCNDFRRGTGAVPIPPTAYSNGSSDDPIVIWQPSTHTEWELWKAIETNGTWTACWGGKLDAATSNGVFPFPYGLSATGISYLATTISDRDVAAGSIDHALAFELPRCDHHIQPSNRGDCGSDPGQPPEGAWFRMAPSTRMPSGLTPFAQMVFRALKTYGAVVTDQAGAVAVQGESPNDWSAEGHMGVSPILSSWVGKPRYATLSGIPWQDLQVVSPPTS